MMLSLMRKHAKSYLIKVLIAIIAIVFVFYFGYSFRSDEGSKIATVNGELITGTEYGKAYHNLLEALQRQYGSMWSESLIQAFDLKNRALQGLIEEKLLSQEARRMGLEVTEDEIKAEILSYPAFQNQGAFDQRRYHMVLSQNRMTPEDFERTLSQMLLTEKMSQFLTAFLPSTEQELREYYAFKNRKVKIQYLTVSPEKYRGFVEVEESGLSEFFKNNIEDYRVPDKVRIAYIEIDPKDYTDKIGLNDQDIKLYYEENISRYKKEKEVQARHILFKVPEDAAPEKVEEVKKKAQEVLEKARGGGDFEELVREYSEGPSKDKGGDLGYFSSGQMVKPFEEAAFAMKPGDISDLVRTEFGFHIIKVEDVREARTQTLAEVQPEIEETLRMTLASDIAHESALSLMDQMPYDVNLEEYAQEQGVRVAATDFFSRGEDIPGITGDEKLEEVVFSLESLAVSDVVEFGDRFYIIQVLEQKPSTLPQLEDVRQEVVQDYKDHLAREKARGEARALLERLQKGEGWKALLAEKEMAGEESDFFTRGGAVQGIGYVQGLDEAVFKLNAGDRYPREVFESDKGFHVIRWVAFEDIDQGEFEKAMADEKGFVRSLKHRALLAVWKEKLTQEAEIEILAPL